MEAPTRARRGRSKAPAETPSRSVDYRHHTSSLPLAEGYPDDPIAEIHATAPSLFDGGGTIGWLRYTHSVLTRSMISVIRLSSSTQPMQWPIPSRLRRTRTSQVPPATGNDRPYKSDVYPARSVPLREQRIAAIFRPSHRQLDSPARKLSSTRLAGTEALVPPECTSAAKLDMYAGDERKRATRLPAVEPQCHE